MILSIPVILAPGGSQASPTEQTLVIPPGILRKFLIMFPAGHAGLTHLVIYFNDRQILPEQIGTDFTGDNALLSFEPNINLNEAPNRIKTSAWNTDDTYSHTIYVWLEIDTSAVSFDMRRLLL